MNEGRYVVKRGSEERAKDMKWSLVWLCATDTVGAAAQDDDTV